jgi:hypothetical protein
MAFAMNQSERWTLAFSYVSALARVELMLVKAEFRPEPTLCNAAVAPKATRATTKAYSTKS